MKVVVMGAGGIGGYVGARLAQAGCEVTLVARGPHLAALQEGGLRLDLSDGRVPVPGVRAVADPAEAGQADLVLFTVKLADAESAAATLAPVMGARTRVLTLQNGIDSKAILAPVLEADRVVEGVIYISTHIAEPGVIAYGGGVHRLVVDAGRGAGAEDPVVAELLSLAPDLQDLTLEAAEDGKKMIWTKFLALSAFSGITCLTRSPIGRVYETAEAVAFYRSLIEENLAVAAAEGVAFPEDQADRLIEMFRVQPYGQKSSMLLDLELGKPLEMPWLQARVCALGESHGIATPANRAVVAALAPFVNGTPSAEGARGAARRGAGRRGP